MCVILMLLATLLYATSTVNAFDCLTGLSLKVKVPSETNSNGGNVNIWNMKKCPAGVERCMKAICTLDSEAMREVAPGKPIPDGTDTTMTVKGCMPSTEEGKCELPDKADGQDLRKIKKYCDVSCNTENKMPITTEATNGGGKTVEQRAKNLCVFGTAAAILAFIAAFFLRWTD
uniref:Uncharacterized protein n=1 Tax=Globodera rostochiensis TaxID=31243 RepID=A0A914HL55_GLORO